MQEANQKNKGSILEITRADQYRTVDELFSKSEPTSSYYTLLILSVLIITPGLMLNNAAIVIGGMLVTPVLTPLLVAGLALSVGEVAAVKRVGILIGKSFFILFLASLIMAFLFGQPQGTFIFENSIQTALLYFIVALVSGVAATFAWARKEISEVLPGIAIAVSLVPPISLVGIWLSAANFDLARFYFLVFFSNLLGIILGSLLVFSLLKFHKIETRIQAKAKEAERQTPEKEGK